jgi:hypothetical protein
MTLEWVNIPTKLCAICDKTDHLATQCPIKEKFQEHRQNRQAQASKYGRLYQRFKPAGTSTLRQLNHQKYPKTDYMLL